MRIGYYLRKPFSVAGGLLAALAGALGLLSAAGCAAAGGPSSALEGDSWPAEVRSSSLGRAAEHVQVAPLPESPSLEDYLAYAALNNAGLEAAFSRWKAALERAPQVRALPDPRFTYRHFIREVETRVGPQEHGVGLAQTLPWFGKLKLRGDAAWEAVEAERMRYEAEKLRLFYRVKDAYCEYYYLGRAIAVVREQRDFLRYLEEVLRTRYRADAARYSDLIRAQVELGKLDDRLRTLIDLREPVVARLNAALNRPAGAELPWPRDIDRQELDATDEEILAWLPAVSPELQELQHEIARQEHAVRLARKDFYPDITVGVDYIDTGSAVMATSDSGKDPVIAMVSINLPIWRGKLEAGVREAQARKRAAVKARTERENALASAVKMVLYRLRDAERKVDLYRDTLLPKGRQSLSASETAFRAGNASFLDVVDAIRALLEFELSHERARTDQSQRLAELEMLVGRQFGRRVEHGPASAQDAPGEGAAAERDAGAKSALD